MNIRISHPSPEPCRMSRRPKLAEATLVAMGEGLSALVFDGPGGRRLTAERDGMAIPKPFVTAALALQGGGVRHMVLMPMARDEAAAHRILLRLDGVPAAEIDPLWLQLPEAGLAALVDRLPEAGMHRLLRLMLTTAASLFSGTAGTGFAPAVQALMTLCGIAPQAPVARTELAGITVLTYRRAAGTAPRETVAIAGGRFITRALPPFIVDGSLVHILQPQPAGAEVVILDDAPVRLAASGAGLRPVPVARWLEGRTPAIRDWLLNRFGPVQREALEREFAPDAVVPSIQVRHLSATASDVVHAFHLHDPDRTLRAVVLERGAARVELPLQGGFGGAPACGVAALPGRPGDDCRIRGLHHSGSLRDFAILPLAPYDGGVPPGFAECWALTGRSPVELAGLRARFRRATPPAAVRRFGAGRAALRIVAPLSGAPALCRARAALILAEAGSRPVEVVSTLPDGPLVAAASRLLAETTEICGVAHRLVVLPDTATAGEVLCAALTGAEDAPALILGADVLPTQPGWLAFWLQRLRRRPVLGGSLIAHDGSIAATGAGADPLCGLPAGAMPAPAGRLRRPMPDCLGLGSAAIARLLACPPHPDTALWLASALGVGIAVEHRFPFRRLAAAPVTGEFAQALDGASLALLADRAA